MSASAFSSPPLPSGGGGAPQSGVTEGTCAAATDAAVRAPSTAFHAVPLPRFAGEEKGAGPKAGFSVLEAIVVLAITSLALLLIFSIGSRASQTGFRLGRRALSVADEQVSSDTVRALLNGLEIPPERGGGGDFIPLVGDAQTLSADASFSRSTPCASAGPAGVVRLSITTAQGHTGLFCKVGDGDPLEIIDFGPHPARFSYAPAGATWSDTVRLGPNPPLAYDIDGSVPAAIPRHLLVRVATLDGRFEVVQLISSGPPPPPSPTSIFK